MALFGPRKGGHSGARAARARKGHAKRRSHLLTSTHYKGHPRKRTKPSWRI